VSSSDRRINVQYRRVSGVLNSGILAIPSAMAETTRRQPFQTGLRPEVLCPLCNQIGGVRIDYLIWQEVRHVRGACEVCHSLWSFPDRRKIRREP